jgi:DNA-binding NtrC family response regulator
VAYNPLTCRSLHRPLKLGSSRASGALCAGFHRFARTAVLECVKVKTSILYFDDEPGLLNMFSWAFKKNYDVLTASTLPEARAALAQCPDIIISDWSMPEISGVDFLREAARVCPDSFRVMLTGYGQVGDVFREVIAGVIQLFITKPWEVADVREALERAALTRARKTRRPPTPGEGAMVLAGFVSLLAYCA